MNSPTREPRSQRRHPAWLAKVIPIYMALNAEILQDLIAGNMDCSKQSFLGPNSPMFLNGAHALLEAAAAQAELVRVPGPWTLWLYAAIHDEKDTGPWSEAEGPRATRPDATWLDTVLAEVEEASRHPGSRQDAGTLLKAFGFCRNRQKDALIPYARSQAAGWIAIWLVRRALPPADATQWLDRHVATFLACDMAAWGSDWPPGWKVPAIDPKLMFDAHQKVALANGSLTMAGKAGSA